MGRPAALTLEMQTKLCAIVAVGCSLRNAARLVGCRESTVRVTAQRDPDFGARLKHAELQREIVPLRNVQTAGAKYWRAAAWSLERLKPDEYGRRGRDSISASRLSVVLERFFNLLLPKITNKEDRDAAMLEMAALQEFIIDESIERSRTELLGSRQRTSAANSGDDWKVAAGKLRDLRNKKEN